MNTKKYAIVLSGNIIDQENSYSQISNVFGVYINKAEALKNLELAKDKFLNDVHSGEVVSIDTDETDSYDIDLKVSGSVETESFSFYGTDDNDVTIDANIHIKVIH